MSNSSGTDAGLAFVKGHGTQNDFVLLPDPDGALNLTPRLAAALCDRRTGIGADGVLRVVRTAHAGPDAAAWIGQAEWFMDYRNADGSLASMCGNGIRVFLAYLSRAGWVPPAPNGSGADSPVAIATRGGVRSVWFAVGGLITVDMGPAVVDEAHPAVMVAVDDVARPAVAVHMPNPHAVTFVDDLAVAGLLAHPPVLWPPEAFPQGANVEFVVVRGPGHLAMRVHERGVGETRSCGTGVCAAAVAARRRTGLDPDDDRARTWRVDTPGGQLAVQERPDGNVELTGPAQLVATGHVDRDWIEEHA